MAFFEEAKVIVDNLDLKRPNKEPMEVFKIFLENDKLGKKKEHAFWSTAMHKIGHAI